MLNIKRLYEHFKKVYATESDSEAYVLYAFFTALSEEDFENYFDMDRADADAIALRMAIEEHEDDINDPVWAIPLNKHIEKFEEVWEWANLLPERAEMGFYLWCRFGQHPKHLHMRTPNTWLRIHLHDLNGEWNDPEFIQICIDVLTVWRNSTQPRT